jgi:single-strand DNA-binding protein
MYAINVNRVLVSGSVVRDPQLHMLPSGETVCNLRLACNTTDHRVTPEGCREKINYFDVKVYGAEAKAVSRRTQKGHAVMVEGRLDWREWETIEGHPVQSLSILAEVLEPLASIAKQREDPLAVDWDSLLASVNV